MKKNKKRATRNYSIKTRIAGALFSLVLLQGLILLFGITLTGVIPKNNEAVYNNLTNQVNSRRNEIQNQFNNRRKNIANLSKEISTQIAVKLDEKNLDPTIFSMDDGRYLDILELAFESIIEFTKYNPVTGVFMVLDSPDEIADREKDNRLSLYIRNSSPEFVANDNGNLLLEYGRVNIARDRNIAVDYLWTQYMSFTDGFYRDFYFKPIDAFLERSSDDEKLHTYGYWSTPFCIKEGDITAITYSLPLVLENGTIYGVLGFELNTNYVMGLMPASEVPYDRGFYLLGTGLDRGYYNVNTISSGAQANQFLSGPTVQFGVDFVYENDKGIIYEINNPNYSGGNAIGAFGEIELYEKQSVFYDEKWALLCMAPKEIVMSGSVGIQNAIIVSIASTILFALVISFFVILYIFSPIKRLHEKVRNIDPERPVRFERTNLKEINELSSAFETLSDGISEAAAKMFKIIELVDLPLGSFELNYRKNNAYLSKSIFNLLELNIPDDGFNVISIEEWKSVISTLEEKSLNKDDEGIIEALYLTGNSWASKKWFRIRMISEHKRDIGILIEITEEMTQKQRLEFERNYDPLTKLLNRQAFMNRAFEIKKAKPNTVGIMMFADLDDLKFMNDTYGHSTGDDYIKSFASFMNKFKEMGGAVGRVSGDEFVMFMNGFGSREEAKGVFDAIFAGLKDITIKAVDGSEHKLRVSVGVSYYPEDTDDVKELLKYADYAMYEIKHTIKGKVKEFDMESYNENSFVINTRNILNLFIEEKRVSFVFQPVVDVRTGEVFAYEAYMRSMMRELNSPADILKMARSQSKLYQLEKLILNELFNMLKVNYSKVEKNKIFINTVLNYMLSENDMYEITSKYEELFKHVIFEFTENEFSDEENAKNKIDALKGYGAMIAVDNYGSGYSNEAGLLSIKPDYLKIDMSIIRDIDKDTDKQNLAQNAIAYAAKRNIKVVAEGVESCEEMETVIRLGVNYVQGYFIGIPSVDIVDIPNELKKRVVSIFQKEKNK